MTDEPRCLFCDHALDGRSKAFCTGCLPPLGEWSDRKDYQARYNLLSGAVGVGFASCAVCTIPPHHPAYVVKPPPVRTVRYCIVCSVELPTRRLTLCGDKACADERSRQLMREQHQRRKADADYRRKRKLEKYKRLALEHRLKAEMYERLASGECVDRYSPVDIAERDGWRCSLCGEPIDRDAHYTDPRSLSIDHVIPLSKGGTDTLENLRAAHMGCNASKGNRPLPYGEQLRLVG